MATRKDVAKLAGVSPASVSYYVNNSGYVSAEKKEKIQKAIEELNYRPNLLAKSLRSQESKQLLLVCNEIRNPFHAELVYYTTKIAYENGYIMLFANVQDDVDYIEQICGYQVSGIIFASNKVTKEQYDRIAKFGIPSITITSMEMDGLDPIITQIKIDTESAIMNIVDVAVGLGHRKLSFLAGCPSGEQARIDLKTRGFIKGIEKNGLHIEEQRIIYNITNSINAYEEVKRLIIEGNHPTAIICANDADAIGALRAVHEAGLKVPDDVVITGVDNTDNAVASIPSLTTIDVSIKMVSQITLDVMFKRLDGKHQDDIVIPTKLIRRESM